MAMVTVTTGSTGDGSTSIASHVDTGASLGELLRQARERKGLTLEKLALETRIPRRHLEALEHDNLTVMPGEFYQRAQIRMYARAVGLDQKLVLAYFDSMFKSVEVREPPREIPVPRESIGRSTYVVMTLGIVTVVVLLGRAIAERPEAPVQQSEAQPAVDSVPPPVPTTPVASTDAVPPRSEQPVAVAPSSPRAESLPPPAVVKTGSTPAAVTTPDVRTPAPTEQATAPAVKAAAPVAQAVPPDVKAATPVVQAASPDAQAAATETRPVAGPAGALVITTEPAGARVTVNGIGWGLSPVTIPYLPPGDKRIRVSKEGYNAQERVLRVAEGQRQSIDVRLDGEP